MNTFTQPTDQHIAIEPTVLYISTPVALLTSLNPDGSTNISPMSSAWALADRVVLGLTSTSQGRANAVRERELVLNFPSPALWTQVESLARLTGRDPVPAHKQQQGYRFEADKFAASGFTPQAAERVRPLRIAECPIQFEAEVVAWHDPGAGWPGGRPAGTLCCTCSGATSAPAPTWAARSRRKHDSIRSEAFRAQARRR